MTNEKQVKNQSSEKNSKKVVINNVNSNISNNECPKKDADGNCLVPGVYRDSDPIGGG